jgi:hypothetical protein
MTKSAGLGGTKTSEPKPTLLLEGLPIMVDKIVSMGWHWTYGMLRMPEHDEVKETTPGTKEFCYCYESPEGDKIFTPFDGHKKRAHMVCRKDKATGELYLSFSKLMHISEIMDKK